MINPGVFICQPLNFKNKLKVYPPRVQDVTGTEQFNQYLKLLTISQEDIEDDLVGKTTGRAPTPFEFLLINCYHDESFRQIAIAAFQFFVKEEVNFFYEQKKLVFGHLEDVVKAITSVDDLITISEDEYFDFQNLIREACGDAAISPSEPKNPNEDPRITAMKAKARARDKLKAKQNAKKGTPLSVSLVAICCMGIGLTPLNIGEMSYAAIAPIMRMSQDKEKYHIDIRSLLAGADSKKIKPKYWIRNPDKD